MPTPKTWRGLIEAAVSRIPPPLTAMTFLSKWSTLCKPVLFECNDRNLYVVKGRENRRALMNEYMVGRLGAAMGAPVPSVQIVHIAQELISDEPEIQHMESGLAHGSAYIKDTIDKYSDLHYGNQRENRPRFAGLSILFGLVYARDVQLIYSKSKPNIVYSIDHAEFFPGWVDDWNPKFLRDAEPAAPYHRIRIMIGLTSQELTRAMDQLAEITNHDIAEAVAGCVDEWGVSDLDRLERAEYIASRRDKLLGTVAA